MEKQRNFSRSRAFPRSPCRQRLSNKRSPHIANECGLDFEGKSSAIAVRLCRLSQGYESARSLSGISVPASAIACSARSASSSETKSCTPRAKANAGSTDPQSSELTKDSIPFASRSSRTISASALVWNSRHMTLVLKAALPFPRSPISNFESRITSQALAASVLQTNSRRC